jgi:hypothetical protein
MRRTIRLFILLSLFIGVVWSSALFSLNDESSREEFKAAAVQEELMSRLKLGQSVYDGGVGYYAKIVDEVKSESILTDLCSEFVSDNYLYQGSQRDCPRI